jgi:hypothetical protein
MEFTQPYSDGYVKINDKDLFCPDDVLTFV